MLLLNGMVGYEGVGCKPAAEPIAGTPVKPTLSSLLLSSAAQQLPQLWQRSPGRRRRLPPQGGWVGMVTLSFLLCNMDRIRPAQRRI